MGCCGSSKTVTTASKPEVKTTADVAPPKLLGDAASVLKGATNAELDVFLRSLPPDVRQKLKIASEPVTLNTVIQQLPKATDAELIAFLSDPTLRARLKKAGLGPADGNAIGLQAGMRAPEPVIGQPTAEESKATEEAGSTLAAGNALNVHANKGIETNEITMAEETADVTNSGTQFCDFGCFR